MRGIASGSSVLSLAQASSNTPLNIQTVQLKKPCQSNAYILNTYKMHFRAASHVHHIYYKLSCTLPQYTVNIEDVTKGSNWQLLSLLKLIKFPLL